MRIQSSFPALLLATVLLSGCETYQYRVQQKPGMARQSPGEAAAVSVAPLKYRVVPCGSAAVLRITNPTDEAIHLVYLRSYAVDAQGQPHRLKGKVIRPHGTVGLALPPGPAYLPTAGSYGGGWESTGWGPGFNPAERCRASWDFPRAYHALPIYFYETRHPASWDWTGGLLELHLSYDGKGLSFDHDLQIEREPAK